MDQCRPPGAGGPCDVLVVGAGPTGLTMAAQLQAFGVPLRLVDAATAPVHESRALAVQPRTLEVLRPLGVAAELLARGNPAARLRIVAGGRVAVTPLFDIGAEDTAFPFLLFVSQAGTEEVLAGHLAARGVTVERSVTFESSVPDGDRLRCALRRADGVRETVLVRHLVGCDGARSTVREQSGIPFRGNRRSPAVQPADRRGRRRPAPRPGDRLPDARVLRAGEGTWLLEALAGPAFHLLLCGPPGAWDGAAVEALRRRFDPWLTVRRLVPGGAPCAPADLVDVSGTALAGLRAGGGTVLVVRPDGHVGARADDGDLMGARRCLAGVLGHPAGAAAE